MLVGWRPLFLGKHLCIGVKSAIRRGHRNIGRKDGASRSNSQCGSLLRHSVGGNYWLPVNLFGFHVVELTCEPLSLYMKVFMSDRECDSVALTIFICRADCYESDDDIFDEGELWLETVTL